MLVVAHCPMKNADWLQQGEKLANPFFGSAMLTCGDVTKKLAAPTEGAELGAVVQQYLIVSKGLAADKLDANAVRALKANADKLPGDKYTSLRQAASSLSEAKDIEAARIAFKTMSAEAIHALEPQAK
jgi:hypothetical protein